MSSIYRKTRDGYYYYQTYVFNPKTKKKDKRIFHALATKNEQEAREKQITYDKKYKKFASSKPFNKLGKLLNGSRKTFLTVFFTSIVTYFLIGIFGPQQKKSMKVVAKLPQDSTIIKKINEISDDKELNVKQRLIGSSIDNVLEKKVLLDDNQFEPSPLPNYEIIRIEQLSQAFGQGKLFVVTDSLNSSDALRKLCGKISKDYSKFKNIVICIYTDDNIGRNIAMGKNDNFNYQQKRKSWLAMYTYNSVEGAFFDDNPTEYLR
tara:strand:+ start:59 stop:847 length:789 start_codon:yes stop_codon:yes gene_type:complete